MELFGSLLEEKRTDGIIVREKDDVRLQLAETFNRSAGKERRIPAQSLLGENEKKRHYYKKSAGLSVTLIFL